MPIVVNLDVMLAKRKMNLTELSFRVGITIANMSILKSGKAKAIRFSTLDEICKVLTVSPETCWNTWTMLHTSNSWVNDVLFAKAVRQTE